MDPRPMSDTSTSAGLFVTFEGGEGSGKTTQIERAAAYLRGRGRDVVVTREPGGSPGAEALRHVLLSGQARDLGVEMEAILFAAARADHVATRIRPALRSGRDVLCDRFHDSTRVYQGQSGVDHALVDLLEDATLQGERPALTVILDLPAEQGLGRAAQRRGKGHVDRFEGEGVELHERRRQAFLDLAKAEPKRCRLVDASRPVEDVAAAIEAILDECFEFSTKPGERAP